MPTQCECSDPGCPVHRGKSECHLRAKYNVFRIDTEDKTGTFMCQGCMEDAMDSGVFSDENPNDS